MPQKWTSILDEEKAARKRVFGEGSVEVNQVKSGEGPDTLYMPAPYATIADKICKFKLRPDDVWIVTYPKCGTTWTQETVWQIVNGLDFEGSKRNLLERSPFLEFEGMFKGFPPLPPEGDDGQPIPGFLWNSLAFTEELPSPRVIKTHLPLDYLPPKLLDTCKVVYVCRNPKDCAVSYYHHSKLFPQYAMRDDATFKEYAEVMFKPGLCGCGSYWHHLKTGWEKRNHPNMKFLWYEEKQKHNKEVIKDLANFLGYPLADSKVDDLLAHTKIDNMREVAMDMETEREAKDTTSKFFRKGAVGDWRNHFDDNMAKEWDKWIEENVAGTDIVQEFETRTGAKFY